MSLNFEFPQWSLRVSGKKQLDNPPREDEVEVEADDWEADLNELDSEVDDKDVLRTNHVSSSENKHEREQGKARGQQRQNQLSEEGLGSAADGELHASASGLPATDHGGSKVAAGVRCIGEAQQGIGGTTYPVNSNASGAKHSDFERPRAARLASAGDSIPAEVLLLVLSELRDVADCIRAAMVCKHWLAVVSLSNELWYELHARHLAGDTWPRPPYTGRPLMQLPPGGNHARSKMLSYKTTCALTQVAVRFMALRKGFEYIVEAAASLWLAVQRAAGGRDRPEIILASTGLSTDSSSPLEAQHHSGSPSRARGITSKVIGDYDASVDSSSVPFVGWRPENGVYQKEGSQQQQQQLYSIGGMNADGGSTAPGMLRRSAAGTDGVGSGVDESAASGQEMAHDGGGSSSGAGDGDGGHANSNVTTNIHSCGASGSGAPGGGAPLSGRARRITHVDQLWESCSRGTSTLQVDGRFNAIRVQQMVGKLCCSGRAQWLPLYEGLAAVMTSRCDEIREDLAAADAAATTAAATVAGVRVLSPFHRTPRPLPTSVASSATAVGAPPSSWSNGSSSQGDGGSRIQTNQPPMFRGEVVYGGSSYADQFAELLRRGDTRGALALGGPRQDTWRPTDIGAGAAGPDGELDEPEMRELLELPNGVVSGVAVPGNLPALVHEGLVIWQRLLRAWALYRRWLEVLVVWCGPLGARVEAERQLAGAVAVHGEAPLAPPHLTNKGLMLFRSQVLLAYPLRRPLQAAALWLSARAAHANDGGGGLYDSFQFDHPGASRGGVRSDFTCDACIGGDGDSGAEGWLTDEQAQLLTGIRKALTELAVPDDATQPAHLHTRQKLQRCFGRLLLRPVPGGTRAFLLAQRLQGQRGTGWGGGGGSRR